MDYKKLFYGTLPLIPAAFTGGYYWDQWLIENSNSKILIDGSYILKGELEKEYISNGEVQRNYISKHEVERIYIPKNEYDRLLGENFSLQGKISEINNAITNDSRILAEGEAWKNNNPEFHIEFGKEQFSGNGVTLFVGTDFQDGKPAWFRLYDVGESRDWKFRHNGKLYKLTAKYIKSKDRRFIETVLTDKI